MPTSDPVSPARRAVIDLLKLNGPMTAAALGASLRVSVVAVRRHLEALEERGLVRQATRAAGRGRPAHVYDLTDAGDELFPRNYHQLVHQLLDAALAEFGPEAVERLLGARRHALAERFRGRIGGGSVAEVAQALAALQDEQGYMADCVADERGAFLVREHNCAVPSVAGRHPAACRFELELLEELAGPGIQVERIAHLRAGDRMCAYRLCAVEAEED